MIARLLLALLIAAALILSCQDQVTNNYYTLSGGAVFGNVVPPDTGTATLNGLASLSTPIDANGYFNFADVPPGIYTLVIQPTNHSKRRLTDVIVGTGITAQFRDTPISRLPYPVYSVSPADSTTGVYTGTYITIRCDEALDLDDLNAKTVFDPPVEGSWGPFYDDYYYDKGLAVSANYTFRPLYDLTPSTVYHMTVAADVHTSSGGTLDHELKLTFTTREYPTYLDVHRNYYTGSVPRRSFHATLSVYRCVTADSVARAVRFEPEISGIWFKSDLYDRCGEADLAREYDFLASDLPLLPRTTYRVIVERAPLGATGADTTEFHTEGYEVINVLPRNGYYGVPVDNQVLVIFNQPMDTLSSRLAFSVSRVGGGEIPGTFTWNDDRTEMTYSHWDNLYTSGAYVIKMTTEAKTEEGEFLDVGWESYFIVR